MHTRFISLFALCILFSANLIAQNDGFKVLISNQNQLVFEYSPNIQTYNENIVNEKKYILPIIENAEFDLSTKYGSPSKIIFSKIISIPSPKAFTLEDIKIGSFKYLNDRIYPLMTPNRVDGISSEEFIVDENAFSSNRLEDFISVEYLGIARDRYLAKISIRAAQYDAFSSRIVIPQNIRATIKFDNNWNKDLGIFAQEVKNISNLSNAINAEQQSKWQDRFNAEYGFATQLQKTLANNFSSNYSKDASAQAPNAEISNGKWAKIEIPEEGIYKISASELSSAGLNISTSDVKTIKVFGNGGLSLSTSVIAATQNVLNEQSIIVNSKPDGSLDNIMFYAAGPSGFFAKNNFNTYLEYSHYLNRFSKNNYYTVTFGGRDGIRATPTKLTNATAIHKPQTYIHRIFEEEELMNAFRIGSGQTFFGRAISNTPFVTALNNLDRNGKVGYKISLAHRSDSNAYFEIKEGNNQIVEALNLYSTKGEYEHSYRNDVKALIDASKIGSDNRSLLSVRYFVDGGKPGTAYFDYYEIHYPRSFTPIDNEIGFFSDSALVGAVEYAISGFTGNIYGFDISNDKSPILIDNQAKDSDKFIFTAENKKLEANKYYISAKTKSAKLSPIEIADLRKTEYNADVILISPKEFLNSAENYKKYREGNSELKIKVVTTDQIYNEFSCGGLDITAIRDFLSYAYHNWQTRPRYVILWGDGHFDYRNIETNVVNHIPAVESFDIDRNSYGEVESPSVEDFYARISGQDELVDVALGRITINSDEAGEAAIEKIRKYEFEQSSGKWQNTVTLVADDGWSGSKSYEDSRHTDQSEELETKYIPTETLRKKVYLVDYPTEYVSTGRRKPMVNAELTNAINNDGTILLNWIGHGNPQVWAHEVIFDKNSNISEYTNIDKLFFLVAATCDFGKMDSYDDQSGAEELFLSKKGGAIGVFSATRVVLSGLNANLANALYRNIFKRDPNSTEYYRIGDIIANVKQEKFDDNSEKYFLIGDPTLRLKLPNLNVAFTEINDVDIATFKDTVLTLKGLSTISVKGEIKDNFGNRVNDFNGKILLEFRDGDILIRKKEVEGGLFIYDKYGGILNASTFEVIDGVFSGEFMLPKDISYSDNKGKLFAFAESNDKRTARGMTSNYIVDGIDISSISDDEAPEIKLNIDSRNFIPGSIVRDNPLLILDLSDNVGINSTGVGIGHKIEAWIDDSPNSIDLTFDFKASLADNRKGSIEKTLFNLKPGLHKIKVRVWDLVNNYATAETDFRIGKADDPGIINSMRAYPNPFDESTTIAFNHNLNPPFNAELAVYNTAGLLIKTINQEIMSAFNSEIVWDGTDNSNLPVGSGAYIYRITGADEKKGTTINFGGIVIVNR